MVVQKVDSDLVLRAGDLAYADFMSSGLAPCKVQKIAYRDGKLVAEVKFTADRGASIRRGMVETWPVGSTVVPRTAVFRSGGSNQYRVRGGIQGVADGWYITVHAVWRTRWGQLSRAQWTLPDEYVAGNGTIRPVFQLDKRVDEIARDLVVELKRRGESNVKTPMNRGYGRAGVEVFVENERGAGRILLSITDTPAVPVGQYKAEWE